MSEESNALFAAQFALEDIRELLRQSAPGHSLTDNQKELLEKQLAILQNSIKVLERLK